MLRRALNHTGCECGGTFIQLSQGEVELARRGETEIVVRFVTPASCSENS
jgi:hypothetical protein